MKLYCYKNPVINKGTFKGRKHLYQIQKVYFKNAKYVPTNKTK